MNRAVLTSVVALAIALAGCGGGDGNDARSSTGSTTGSSTGSSTGSTSTSTSSTTVAAPTKAEYIAKADAVCSEYKPRLAALNRKLGSASEGAKSAEDVLSKIAPVLEKAAALRREGTEKLAAIEAPSNEQQKLENWIDMQRDENALIARLANAADRSDAKAYSTLAKDVKRLSDGQKAFDQKFGFQKCGQE